MRTADVGVHEDRGGEVSPPAPQSSPEPAAHAAIQAAKAAKKALQVRRVTAEPPATDAPVPATAAEPVDGVDEEAEAAPEEAEAAAADAAVDADAPVDADATAGRPAGRGPLTVALAALVVCLAFAVSALVVHLTAGSGTPSAAAARNDALLAARQDIVVLNTLDYRQVQAGLRRWSDASTGALHAQLTRVSTDERKRIVAAQAVTTAKILDAAVVNLDPAAGSATVIASVELTVHPAGKAAQVKRERLRAQLVRIGDTWKVSALDQVGVTLS